MPKDEHATEQIGVSSVSPCEQCTLRTTPRSRLDALFMREKDEWATPHAVFTMLDREFHFTLDACATSENAKCNRFFTKEDDGLRQDYGTERVWMNPPYSQLGKWVRKAYDASLRGALVVCLTFARTDTAAFHDAVAHASQIRFLRGRLRFGNAKNCAPAPSCIIIFRPTTATPPPAQLSFGFNGAKTTPVSTLPGVTV